jgi:Selenocysteine lyase
VENRGVFSLMEIHSGAKSIGNALDERHRAIVEREFPRAFAGVTYLNAGSAGRKPNSVLDAVSAGWQHLNINPTLTTFLEEDWISSARNAAAKLFSVNVKNLLLTDNTTAGLQLIMQSFLKNPGDELITTDHEHGSVKTVIRHLEETRGVVTRMHSLDAGVSSNQFCLNILSSVSERTKLVLLSEIDCFTGWKPDLNTIVESLEMLDVPLLVDGAHSPGHLLSRPGAYPMWVGSGHKWLGGPNSTGFAYVSQELIPRLEPVWLGDYFFNKRTMTSTTSLDSSAREPPMSCAGRVWRRRLICTVSWMRLLSWLTRSRLCGT